MAPISFVGLCAVASTFLKNEFLSFFRILGRPLPEEDGRLGASLSMRFRLNCQQANNAKEMAQAWPGAHGCGGVVVTKLDKRPLNNQEQDDQAGLADSGQLERYVGQELRRHSPSRANAYYFAWTDQSG